LKDIDLSNLDISEETMEKLLSVSEDEWKKEIPTIEEFYSKFGDRMPKELKNKLDELKKKFSK
jgi:phosphoenolpyruvate carboxykinase (GTP)